MDQTFSLLERPGSCVGRALPRSTPTTSGGSIGFPRYKLVAVGGARERKCKVMTQLGCHLLETSHHCSSLVDPVREAPAAVRVSVSVSRVDEAVLERPADVVSRQTGDRRHHVPGELSNLQRALVLTPPPVVLCPKERERQKRGLKRLLGGLGEVCPCWSD